MANHSFKDLEGFEDPTKRNLPRPQGVEPQEDRKKKRKTSQKRAKVQKGKTSFTINNLDAALWKKVKIKALKEDKGVVESLETILKDYFK